MRVTNQIVRTRGSFGFVVSEMPINGAFEIQKLIDAKIFDLDVLPIFAKESILRGGDGINYLKGLFRSEKLVTDDFKYMPNTAIYYYLEGFSDGSEEWGEDKPFFKNLLNDFRTIVGDRIKGCYLINKEWFNADSPKVREVEFMCYSIYFIVIWNDAIDNDKVYVSEWSSD